MSEINHQVLFTDPTDPAWTLIEFCGKTLVMHACVAEPSKIHALTKLSDDACRYCTEEPPPGFIALYKLHTWDK